MSEKFYESGSFWSGVSLYYVALWIFSFYPAFIVSIALQRMFFEVEWNGDLTPESAMFGFLAMIVGTFVILGFAVCKQKLIVLMIYLLTTWPFLYILNHWCHASDSEMYPVPLDFWPLW